MINQRCGLFAALLLVLITSSACGLIGSTAPTPAVTRVATQTPWIIYVPITSTPEPLIATPFPTVTGSARATATRTSTRVAPPATKPAAAVPTKAAATTAPAVVQPSAVPACSAGAVTLLFPENGAPRTTRKDGSGGSAFILKWTPYQQGDSDPTIGYQITFSSKRSGFANGATVYVSHNKFLQDGQQYIYDQRAVSTLASGESATVTWYVTVVKATGGFDNQGGASGSVVNCGPSSQPFTIALIVP